MFYIPLRKLKWRKKRAKRDFNCLIAIETCTKEWNLKNLLFGFSLCPLMYCEVQQSSEINIFVRRTDKNFKGHFIE